MRSVLIWVIGAMLVAGTAAAEDGTSGTRRASHGALGGASNRAERVPEGALDRLPNRVKERLETLSNRWRDDSRVQTASTIVGLSAAALGAVQGNHAIAFAGTHVTRWGLGRQLNLVEQRSGFQLVPSVGRHHIVITARKIFD